MEQKTKFRILRQDGSGYLPNKSEYQSDKTSVVYWLGMLSKIVVISFYILGLLVLFGTTLLFGFCLISDY